MKRFIAILILLSAGLNIWQSIHIKKLETKRPIVVYKADNQGAEIKGRILQKEKIGDMYTITVQNYGVFVVTQTNLDIIMDYEWKQMQEQAEFIKANTRKWRARCS